MNVNDVSSKNAKMPRWRQQTSITVRHDTTACLQAMTLVRTDGHFAKFSFLPSRSHLGLQSGYDAIHSGQRLTEDGATSLLCNFPKSSHTTIISHPTMYLQYAPGLRDRNDEKHV